MKDAEPDTAHRASRNDLVLEDFFCFSIQLVGKLIDPSYLVLESCSGSVAEQASNCFRHECGSVSRNVIDLFRKIIGDCDVHAHTIKVSQSAPRRNDTRGPLRPTYFFGSM